MRVLVVEDNVDLSGNLIDYLSLKQCVVDAASNGRQALTLLSQNRFDVIVLDVMMPGIDGLEVCRQIRAQSLTTPVLFLTARDTLDDKLEGFAAGGDDYLLKPFAMDELYVRLLALCKRSLNQRGNRLEVADLVMDLDSHKVFRAGQQLHLNRSCMTLLKCLMQHSPDVVPRETLCYALWGDDLPDQDVLRSHLYGLRSVIDKPFATPLLHTIYGVGFRLMAQPDES